MPLLTSLKRRLITFPPVKAMIRRSKRMCLPGFRGIPLFDVINFFFAELKKEGLSERASAISFNLVMAIPPSIIFLFTLIPHMPISGQFINELYQLIRDVVPGKENESIISFMDDFLKNPRNGLLSFGFLLALYFSSNAMLGIMRSFDKNYIGFRKRTSLQARKVALRLTLIVFVLVLICVALLIAQGAVLRWLGVESSTLRTIIVNFKWVFIALLFLAINSFIFRQAPAVQKKWKLINPGSVLATFLMIITTLLFSVYVNNFSSYNTLYGSIGTIIMLTVLIYTNSLLLLIGFELNVSISSLKRIADERNEAQKIAATLVQPAR